MNTPILVLKRLQHAKSKEEMEELLLLEELSRKHVRDVLPQNAKQPLPLRCQQLSQQLSMASVRRTSAKFHMTTMQWTTTATMAVTSPWT